MIMFTLELGQELILQELIMVIGEGQVLRLLVKEILKAFLLMVVIPILALITVLL